MSSVVLETVDLQRNFGAVEVTSRINFSLTRGERHALIGPNGAGKTTFINLLTGTLRPSSGAIYLHGKPITLHSPARRVKQGLVRTFQINQLFQHLSTQENVALAAREALNIGATLLVRKSLSTQANDRVLSLLDAFGLTNQIDVPISGYRTASKG